MAQQYFNATEKEATYHLHVAKILPQEELFHLLGSIPQLKRILHQLYPPKYSNTIPDHLHDLYLHPSQL